MLSFLNMECSACSSEYTLSIEELNVAVFFKCFECGQHNIYVAGHVLELDPAIMDEGTEKEKRRHIVEIVQSFACNFAGNVLKNVERLINVNMEIDLPETNRRKKKSRKNKTMKPPKEIPGARLSPSVLRANAPEISLQEISDFVKIDLNLIDKKKHFRKFFEEPKE